MSVVPYHLGLLCLATPVVMLSDNTSSSAAGGVGKEILLLQVAADVRFKFSMLRPNISSTSGASFVAAVLPALEDQDHVHRRNNTRRRLSLTSIRTKETELSTDALVCGTAFAVVIMLCSCYEILNSRLDRPFGEKKSTQAQFPGNVGRNPQLRSSEAGLLNSSRLAASQSKNSMGNEQNLQRAVMISNESPEVAAALPKPIYSDVLNIVTRFKIPCKELENACVPWPEGRLRRQISIFADGKGKRPLVLYAHVEKPDRHQGSIALSKPGVTKNLATLHFVKEADDNATRLLVDKEGSEYGIMEKSFSHGDAYAYLLKRRVGETHNPVSKKIEDHYDPVLWVRSSGKGRVSLRMKDDTLLARAGIYIEYDTEYLIGNEFFAVRVDLGTDPVLVLLCILGVMVLG